MMNALTLQRDTADGKYADILDAAELLGNAEYGSASNALAQMVRKSPLYAEALRRRLNHGNPNVTSSPGPSELSAGQEGPKERETEAAGAAGTSEGE